MLRIIILVTTFIAVKAESTLTSYSPSNEGFKSYDYGSRNLDKYSRGATKYFLSSASSPGQVNSLSSNYPSIYSSSNQGQSLSSQVARNYENVDSSYLSDAPTTISSYSRDRPYALSNSDYTSSLSSQPDFSGSSNPQSAFSGRTDYEGSSGNDYSGVSSQQFTVGTSYRGASVDSYPRTQETSNIRGFVTSSQGPSPAASGFVSSPNYSDSSRSVYGGSGFKPLDTSGFRGYFSNPGVRDFVGKHRGHVAVISSKYPTYENAASEGFSGNEVESSPISPHVYSSGNYKRESYNSAGSTLPAGNTISSGFSGFNYLPGNLKGTYSIAGLKAQSLGYPGQRESGPVSFGGLGGSEGGSRFIISGSPNFGSYSSSPSLIPKGHGSYLLGTNNGSGKFIIMKDNASAGSHISSSSYPGAHMYSMSPIVGGSFKTTRGADFGSQGSSFSYSPSFAGGSSPSYPSRFITRGNPAYMTAS